MGFWSSVVGIIGVVAAPFTGGLSLIATAAAVVAPKIVDKVVDFVMKPFMKAFGAPDMPDMGTEVAKQEGYLITRTGGNEALPVIYGFRATGGIAVFAETGPIDGTPKNKYLWVAYALCEGPVEGLKTLSLDDREFPESIVARLNSGETVDVKDIPNTVPSYKYNGVTKLRFYNGTYYNNPSSSTVGADIKAGIFATAPNFTSDMTFNGVAVLLARYELIERTTQEQQDNNPFTGGIPSVLAGVMGRKVQAIATTRYTNGVYDAGATATMTDNVNTWWTTTLGFELTGTSAYDPNGGRYSTNPAECLFDYLRNPRYGKGLMLADIDQTTWQLAANKCNQFVIYYNGAKGPILTMNYIVSTEDTLFNNVKTMLAGFRGYMPYVQGQYKLKIEDAGNEYDIISSVASIVATVVSGTRMSAGYDDNVYDIVGDVTYTGIDRSSKYTHVVISYVDPDQKWSTQQAVWPQTEAERQVYINEDGGRENKAEMAMPTITNSIMALDMARLIFNKSRYQESCNMRVSVEGFELEPGDSIRIQSNILNFGDTAWRVISTTLSNDYTFDITCVRNPATIYPYILYDLPDVVRPTYVARQNEVYLPNVNSPLMGIFPPSYAPLPAGWTGTLPPGTTTPTVPTDPGTGTNPGGGGVGGGGGAIDGGTPITNPPTTPPTVVVRTDHIIVFTSSTYNSANNSYTVKFTIPDGIQYGGVRIWWRPSSVSSYIDMGDLASGARDFTFQSPSSFAQPHYVVARLKYSNGEYSTNRNKATLFGAASGISSQLIDNGDIVVQDPTVVNINAPIELIKSIPITPSTTPKGVTLTVKEPIVRDQLPNRNIAKVLVYYRNASMAANQYYLYDKFTPPTGYFGNAEFTIPMAQLFDSAFTDWSIILRWKFTDGRLSNYIYRQNIRTDVDTLGIVGGYTNAIPTIMLAPDPAVTNSTAALTSAFSIQRGSLTDKMQIHFANPSLSPISMSNWSGVRVDIAEATPGQTLSYQTYNFPTAQCFTSGLVSGYYVQIQQASFTALKSYHVIITLSYTSGGTTAYSTKAIKYSGGYYGGQDYNQIGSVGGLVLAGSPTDYTTLKQEYSSAPIPGQPVDKQVVSVDKIEEWRIASPAISGTADASLGVPHFRITASIPTSITVNKIRVYRRYNSGSNVGPVEYSDYTGLSGQDILLFRYARNNLPSTQVDKSPYATYAYTVTDQASYQEIWVRVYTGTGTASNSVVKVTNTGNANITSTWVNVTPPTYNSSGNVIDLTVDTALATLLSNATQSNAAIEVPNAGACRVKWEVEKLTFGGDSQNSGFLK